MTNGRKIRATIRKNVEQGIKNISEIADNKKKAIALASVVALTGIAGVIITHNDSEQEDDKIYIVDVNDKKESDLELFDEKGTSIELKYDNLSEVVAIVTENDFKRNKRYSVTLVDDTGKMQSGYVDGKYLEEKEIQEISEIDQKFLSDICMVSAKSGAWLRKAPIIDTKTDDAVLLEPGTYVLSSEFVTVTPYNDYAWKEVLWYDGEQLNYGYIASEYLINADFDKVKGTKMTVNTELPLRIRKESNTSAEELLSLEPGSEVILVPNIATEVGEGYEWYYVAAKQDDDIVLGFSAGKQYLEDGTVAEFFKFDEEEIGETQELTSETEELTSETEELTSETEIVTENVETIMKRVNTESVSGVPLKLREQPSISSEIIAKIQNGSTVYTTQELFDKALESELVDGHRWVEVELINGDKGYVAIEYLEEYVNEQNKKYQTVSGNFGGMYNGYLAIDCSPDNISTGKLGDFLDNGIEFKDEQLNTTYTQVPNAVIIKLGATGWGNAFSLAKNSSYYEKVHSLALLCESHQIPYGFYYLSHATNDKEREAEENYIEGYFKKYGKMPYNILPFTVDIEEGGDYNSGVKGRAWKFAQNTENGKEKLTAVFNQEMNNLRESLDMDVNMYICNNALNEMINFSSFDEENKKNVWCVDSSNTHSQNLANYHPEVVPNIKIRQITLDTIVDGTLLDFDFIDQEYFEQLMKEKLGIDICKTDREEPEL